MKAIRTRLAVAAALMSMALVNGSIDDVFAQSAPGREPSVSTYATGLTNPRGLTFGPDGNLYVAEAGTGGSQTPADIDPSCPVMVNVFSP
jgi:glucose/arabinose dehydrogenase